MKIEKTIKIEFENDELELLKNICEYTNILVDLITDPKSELSFGGRSLKRGTKEELKKCMLDDRVKYFNFINKVNNL